MSEKKFVWTGLDADKHTAYLHFHSNRDHPIICIDRTSLSGSWLWFVNDRYGALSFLFENGRKYKTKRACIKYAEKVISIFSIELYNELSLATIDGGKKWFRKHKDDVIK